MPTTVISSTGARAADSVTVNTVTSTTVTGYTNAWSVVLSATVPSTTKIGDKLTVGANSYLITNISGSTLTVVGDAGIAFTSTTTPATGAATTARSYSSPNLWSAGAPASLITKDWIWRGEIYKEGSGTNNEWVLGSTFFDVNIDFTSAGDSTRYFIMTAAAGQAFNDNANKLTNALRYNAANGVAIYCDGAYSTVTVSTGTAPVFISNLQLRARSGLAYAPASGGCRITYVSCIGVNGGCLEQIWANNTLFINVGFGNQGSNLFVACTMIGTGGGLNSVTGGVITLTDCAVFNVTAINGLSTSSNYNATSIAAPANWGANSLASKTYANQFENIGSGTEDFRVKTGADLISAGIRDQTYTNDLDIVGTARSTAAPPNGPTIGAWEYAGVTPPPTATDYSSPMSRGIFRGIERGVA